MQLLWLTENYENHKNLQIWPKLVFLLVNQTDNWFALKAVQAFEFGGVDKKCVYKRITFSRFLAYERVILMHVIITQYQLLIKQERSTQFNQSNRVIYFALYLINFRMSHYMILPQSVDAMAQWDISHL